MSGIKGNKGITLIVLAITVIILMVLGGVSILGGTEVIKRVKTENIVTNMIMLKSKSKIYAEEVNSKVWDLSSEEKSEKKPQIFQDEYYMIQEDISDIPALDELSSDVTDGGYECYLITSQTLDKMGLSDINDGQNYVVVYNESDYTKLDIIYKVGTEYNDNTYYSLTKLQTKMGE